MDENRKFVTCERKFLNRQRQNCNEDPDSFYMEIDGMDQSKTNLPHLSCSCRWAEFLSLVRRCICRVSALVIGGRSLLGSVGGVCSVIGHIVCACV